MSPSSFPREGPTVPAEERHVPLSFFLTQQSLLLFPLSFSSFLLVFAPIFMILGDFGNFLVSFKGVTYFLLAQIVEDLEVPSIMNTPLVLMKPPEACGTVDVYRVS